MTIDPQQVQAYARAMLAVARAEDNVDEVTDEVFRFARALESSDDLRSALTNQRLETSRRQQIVEDLLGGRASDTTLGLLSMVIGAGRIGDLPKIADRLAEMGAASSNREVARVRTAVALTDDQKQRLTAALAKATGTDIDLKVIIDPSVVGGVVTEIGDTVFDGSVRSRLAQLKEGF